MKDLFGREVQRSRIGREKRLSDSAWRVLCEMRDRDGAIIYYCVIEKGWRIDQARNCRVTKEDVWLLVKHGFLKRAGDFFDKWKIRG